MFNLCFVNILWDTSHFVRGLMKVQVNIVNMLIQHKYNEYTLFQP